MSRTAQLRIRRVAVASIAAGTLFACATVPQEAQAQRTAQRAGGAITAAEAQQGAEYHPQFLREFVPQQVT